jgi:hypothetical protein
MNRSSTLTIGGPLLDILANRAIMPQVRPLDQDFKPPAPGEMVSIEGELAREVQQISPWAGFYDRPISGEFDTSTRKAQTDLNGNENLSVLTSPGGLISGQVIDISRGKFAPKTT